MYLNKTRYMLKHDIRLEKSELFWFLGFRVQVQKFKILIIVFKRINFDHLHK